MIIKYLNYFLFFLCCIFIIGNSYSEEWKAACEINNPPFNYINDGNKIGLDYEIVDLVMKKIGIKYSIQNTSWDKVLSLLNKNKVDFAWQFVQTPERQKLFYLVGPIRYGLHVFMVKNNSNLTNWQKLSDFDNKKIGIIKKYNYTHEFDIYKGFSKIEFANVEELFKGLLDGYVDAIIGDFYTFSYISKTKHYSSKVRFLPSSIKKIPRYIAFSKKNIKKAKKFEDALKDLLKTKEYQNIIEKYSSR